jgi:hypothetical protein
MKIMNVINIVEQKRIEQHAYYSNNDIGNEYFYDDIVL